MATIPQLQIPQLGAVSGGADFAPLANLGDIYRKAQQDRANKDALAVYQQTGDPKSLAASGDMSLIKLGIEIEREKAAQAFRERQQSNTESYQNKSLGLQQRTADRLDDRTPAGFRKKADGTGIEPIPGGPHDPNETTRAAEIKSQSEKAMRAKEALAQGLQPGTPAFIRYVLTGTTASAAGGAGGNPPSGYTWNDPEDPTKGVKPIPGGPGEKVDAEVAGRLGLAKSFLTQLPKIKEDVEKGVATGVWDAGMALAGRGRPGEIRRQIGSGADALTRLLTGAGMNNTEAAEYADRYRLGPSDTAAMVKSKLDQLEIELNTIGAEVGKGRGGWSSPTPQTGGGGGGGNKPDPLGLR